MVLDAALLNTQHYKVRIKGKVEQSREWSSAFPTLNVVAIEKGAFGSPSTMVALDNGRQLYLQLHFNFRHEKRKALSIHWIDMRFAASRNDQLHTLLLLWAPQVV